MQADDEKAATGAFFAAVTRLLSVCRSQRDAQISLDQSFENCVTQHVARVGPGASWLPILVMFCHGEPAAEVGRVGGASGGGAWAPPASQGLRTFVTPKAGFLATRFQLKPRTKMFRASAHFPLPI